MCTYMERFSDAAALLSAIESRTVREGQLHLLQEGRRIA